MKYVGLFPAELSKLTKEEEDQATKTGASVYTLWSTHAGSGNEDAGSSSLPPLPVEFSAVAQEYATPVYGNWALPGQPLLLGTLVDPLFATLDRLDKLNAPNFMPLRDLCEAAQCGRNLTTCLSTHPAQLEYLCDMKQVGDEAFYRLSQPRVLAWLVCKVRQTVGGLKDVLKPEVLTQMEGKALDGYAAGILGEYITSPWSDLLLEKLGLKDSSLDPASVSTVDASLGFAGFDADPDKKKAGVIMTKAEVTKLREAQKREEKKKQDAIKVAQGTKSIHAFFQKKEKK